MKKKKLALLCDYGLDDAIATSFVFFKQELLERVDIVPIAGNMPLETVKNNAVRLMDALKPSIQVNFIDTASIPQHYRNLTFIHGNDGMGDVLRHKESKAVWISIEEWIEHIPEDEIIVSLGPATVADYILKKTGGRKLYIMGGNICDIPNTGNYEFNHIIDKKAFEAMVEFPHIIATLDTCNRPLLNFDSPRPNETRVFYKLLNRYIELCRSRKEPGNYVYDLVAVCPIFYPELFSTHKETDNDGNKLNVLRYIGTEPLCEIIEKDVENL